MGIKKKRIKLALRKALENPIVDNPTMDIENSVIQEKLQQVSKPETPVETATELETVMENSPIEEKEETEQKPKQSSPKKRKTTIKKTKPKATSRRKKPNSSK